VLTEESEIGNLDTFRVSTCIYQEQLTREMNKKAINARIGHVFGESEGIFPFIRLSSQLRTKKFGKGGQYVPWIHVDDVAESFYFMAINP
jgi:NAD dependent epimerase/dehydratase family enzyme